MIEKVNADIFSEEECKNLLKDSGPDNKAKIIKLNLDVRSLTTRNKEFAEREKKHSAEIEELKKLRLEKEADIEKLKQ